MQRQATGRRWGLPLRRRGVDESVPLPQAFLNYTSWIGHLPPAIHFLVTELADVYVPIWSGHRAHTGRHFGRAIHEQPVAIVHAPVFPPNRLAQITVFDAVYMCRRRFLYDSANEP